MYHTLVRTVLQAHLTGAPIPSFAELGVESHPDTETKHLAFVTLYRNGEVVASSGRVHNTQQSTIAEARDNALHALQDPRLGQLSPEALQQIQIRVDVLESSGRRVLPDISLLDARNEGLILLSQNLGKLGVLLPGIVGADKTPQELFAILCAKVNMPVNQPSSEYVLYGVTSKVYSDF
jgi:AMMECR1 domain-containing protein